MKFDTDTLGPAYEFYVTGHTQQNNVSTFAGSYSAANEAEAIAYFIGHVARAFDVPKEEVVIDSVHAKL